MLSDNELDLGMREADVAIRMVVPRQPGLIQRHLLTVRSHVYAGHSYIQKYGKPRTVEDLDKHRLIIFGEDARAPVQDVNWLLKEGNPDDAERTVVLVHGGGGTAFAEWVTLWAKRGYAAIAMDLAGSRPDPAGAKKDAVVRLPDGGPGQSHTDKFDTIATPAVGDDWPYHAVANCIRAHSLLRSLPGVDPSRTDRKSTRLNSSHSSVSRMPSSA